MKLAIPSYFYPDNDLWKRVLAVQPAVVVINPNSGPGDALDVNYKKLCAELFARGIRTLGYIATGRATPNDEGKQIWQVNEERERYGKWYPVVDGVGGLGGFFYDEAATGKPQLFYYMSLVRLAQGGIASMVVNPGTFCDKSYLKLPAVKMIYETSFATYMQREPPQWVLDEPNREHFWHCIYGVKTKADAVKVAEAARRRNAGYVWITHGVQPNPYDTLPDYFEALPEIIK